MTELATAVRSTKRHTRIWERGRAPGRRWLFALQVAVSLLAERRAFAEASTAPQAEPRSVVVAPSLCESEAFAMNSFLDALRVELSGSGIACCTVAVPSQPKGEQLRLTLNFVSCASGTERVQLGVQMPNTAKAVEREISLGDVSIAARPRALALAAAELIRTVEHQESEPPAPIPVRNAESPPASRKDVPSQLVFSTGAAFEARFFPVYDTILWGGRVRMALQKRALLTEFDLGGDYAHKQTELGQLLLTSTSAGLSLGPHFAVGGAALNVGAHAELGWARVSSATDFSDVHTTAGSGVFATVGIRGSLETPSSAKLRAALALEGGGAVRSFNADVDGKSAMGITGYYLLAALGLAVTL